MTDRHLFVADPIEDFDPQHDTTYVIMRELQKRGHEIWCCRSVDLAWENRKLWSQARRVSVSNPPRAKHFVELECALLEVDECDLIWMREDPPFDSQYLYSTYLLEKTDVPVINDPRGIRDCNEKLFILEFPEFIPETWVGADVAVARDFLKKVGGVAVAKTLSGYGGEEVYLIKNKSSRTDELLNQITSSGEKTVMLQEFLPGVSEGGDRRVIVVGGRPVGVLNRVPASGDFRSNIHSGGSAHRASLTEKERWICSSIKDSLLARGLHLVGLDLVDDKILEINVTSPTCVQEINKFNNIRLEEKIVDYVYHNILE
ncbi:MAG: glutathione synthase [bacterium]